MTPYVPKRDGSGRLIADLSSRELRRRLAILRVNDDGHWMTAQYKRAYEATLRARGAA